MSFFSREVLEGAGRHGQLRRPRYTERRVHLVHETVRRKESVGATRSVARVAASDRVGDQVENPERVGPQVSPLPTRRFGSLSRG